MEGLKNSDNELPRNALRSTNAPSKSRNPNVFVKSAKLLLDKAYTASLVIACFDWCFLTISTTTRWMTANECSAQDELAD